MSNTTEYYAINVIKKGCTDVVYFVDRITRNTHVRKQYKHFAVHSKYKALRQCWELQKIVDVLEL